MEQKDQKSAKKVRKMRMRCESSAMRWTWTKVRMQKTFRTTIPALDYRCDNEKRKKKIIRIIQLGRFCPHWIVGGSSTSKKCRPLPLELQLFTGKITQLSRLDCQCPPPLSKTFVWCKLCNKPVGLRRILVSSNCRVRLLLML
jgi:hypothetical protein